MKYFAVSSLLATLALAGCGGSDSNNSDDTSSNNSAAPTSLSTQLKTANSYEDIADAAIWVSPNNPDNNLLVVTLEGDGLAIFDNNGTQVYHDDTQEFLGADIRYGLSDGAGNTIDLLAVALPESEAFAFYAIREDQADPITELGTLDITLEPAGVCLYKNVTTDEVTITGFSEDGGVIQYKLRYDGVNIVSAVTNNASEAVAVRQLTVGGELSACAVDDESSTLFLAEQDLGIWAYGADPENVKLRGLVDTIEPLGYLQEIEGLDIVYMESGEGYLVVGDEGAGFLLYEKADDYSFVGQLPVAGFAEAKSLASAPDALWLANTEADEPVYEKLTSASISTYLENQNIVYNDLLSLRDLEVDGVNLVQAKGETTEVDDDGDAADDPAFWLHPSDVSKSLILGTNKQGGLMAYDLNGQEVQYLEGGRPNNIDLRNVTGVGNASFTLAAASNRELNTISLYQIVEASDTQAPIQPINAEGNAVHPEAAELVSGVDEVYGLCMYQATDGTAYVFVNGKDGNIEQWRLTPTATGVEGTLVRNLAVNSQPEGCVADDAEGKLYLGEENVGIWVFDADESAPTTATSFARIDGDRLVADVEGLTLYQSATEKYLIASSQGNNTYAVYNLLDNNNFMGTFAIIGDDSNGLDGASDTDGIDVISANLGADYPAGMFIAQDWYNIDDNYQLENQNFKMVSWQDIIDRLAP